MFAHIPIEAFGVLIVGNGELFILSGLWSHSLWRIFWCAGCAGVTYAACRALTAWDHNIFRVLHLWLRTKGRSTRNARYWGGSSVTPLPLNPPRREKDVVTYA